MKKYLLIMTLALLGGVTQVKAQVTEDGFMKVYIQNQLISSWDKIILRHWGTSPSREAADVMDSGTEIIDGITWHVFKINIDYANNAPFLVYNGTWEGTNQSSNFEIDGNVYGDTFFDLKQADASSQPYLERQTRFYLYNTETHKSIKFNTTDFSTFSLNFNNSDGTLNGYYVITSNYAYKGQTGGVVADWNNNVFRPQTSGDLTIDFSTYTNQNAPRVSSGGGAWYINKDFEYDISFTLGDWSNSKWSIAPYFERTLPAAAEGYATFSSSYDVIPDPNLESVKYASAINTSTGKITWENFGETGIHSSDGALLKGTAGGTYKFTPATSASAKETNYLKPIVSATTLAQTGTGTKNYILTKRTTISPDAELCFYLVNASGSKCAAGTAYLEVPTSGAREFFPVIWDESASVEGIEMESQNKNLSVYDLQGRRVNNPKKGLYIVNGKKVAIK